jgi:hypothetical protein
MATNRFEAHADRSLILQKREAASQYELRSLRGSPEPKGVRTKFVAQSRDLDSHAMAVDRVASAGARSRS